MIKKILTVVLCFIAAVSANAQFTEGTKYVSTSLTGLNLQYNGSEKFRIGVDAKAGLFFADNLLGYATVGYEHTRYIDEVNIGLGARYYFSQNGIFMGAGAEYQHMTKSSNDVVIPIEVGYAFYLNHYLTVEPALYYKMSLHDFSNNSTVGLRIGFGYYF